MPDHNLEAFTSTQRKRPHFLDDDNADQFIKVNVWVVYWTFKVLGFFLRRSFRVEIRPDDVVRGSRYIIAGNHQSIADPFIMCSQFPYAVWKQMGTLRYFTARGLFRAPILREFLMALGCFPARVHPKYPSGLDYGLRQLQRGRAVMIFPEGWRTRRGEREAKHGVQVLARSHPHVMVIPVHIEWSRKWWFIRTFRVGIGSPFEPGEMSAQEILDRIYAQPVA